MIDEMESDEQPGTPGQGPGRENQDSQRGANQPRRDDRKVQDQRSRQDQGQRKRPGQSG